MKTVRGDTVAPNSTAEGEHPKRRKETAMTPEERQAFNIEQ